jgi:hypothetical protein
MRTGLLGVCGKILGIEPQCSSGRIGGMITYLFRNVFLKVFAIHIDA